jgi:hypothetical protein
VLGDPGGAFARLQDGFVIEKRLVHRGAQSSSSLPFVILRAAQRNRGTQRRRRRCVRRTDLERRVRDRVLLAQAAGSPGLRREDAACRRMTKGEDQVPRRGSRTGTVLWLGAHQRLAANNH